MERKCYVISSAQVSCQAPLRDTWFDTPVWHRGEYVRAVEPDSKAYLAPGESRRMSRLLRRAICTSSEALRQAGVEMPDAIVTGTGTGCQENSERFLEEMCDYGENCLKPSLFMQSTHNTISSSIAVRLGCHGYNTTYSHGTLSLESALLDAWLQIKSGATGTALVGSHDEVTPLMATVLRRIRSCTGFISECSVSALLRGGEGDNRPLCSLDGVTLLRTPGITQVADACCGADAVLLGITGDDLCDEPYLRLAGKLGDKVAKLHYKHLFGTNDSSSAAAFHAGVRLISEGRIPGFMYIGSARPDAPAPRHVAIATYGSGGEWGVTRISSC